MALCYWCVLAAALMPYLWTAVAKVGARGYDNNAPRQFAESLAGIRQRANWAQYNSFEAFPAFAAGVIIAQLSGVEAVLLNALAVAFVVARLIYGVCYLYNQASLRSVFWFLGILIMVALYLAAGLGWGAA